MAERVDEPDRAGVIGIKCWCLSGLPGTGLGGSAEPRTVTRPLATHPGVLPPVRAAQGVAFALDTNKLSRPATTP